MVKYNLLVYLLSYANPPVRIETEVAHYPIPVFLPCYELSKKYVKQMKYSRVW